MTMPHSPVTAPSTGWSPGTVAPAQYAEGDQFETAIDLFLDAVELRAQRARGEGSERPEN
ncbi:hypothetical protein QNO09_37260 [Streptomyces sp. 378]|uniref:hypothetical protein n=1 Tax=Streptomyces sp. 378 TaxID=3049412 RepID=UPI0024C373DB|nr:hypothetical protein [Streptomyces sp. 378]MDK1348816.1 hypothetical protein [Streptomyces sp. 378]